MPTLYGPIMFVRPSAYQELKSSPKNPAGSFNNFLGCNAVYSSSEGHHVQKLPIVPTFRVNFTRVSHYLYRSLSERTTRHWLHRFHVNASSDEDFRSSRNIATSLFKQYKNVIDRGGGDNIKGFVSAGVQAYALGCTEEGLRMELMDIKQSGLEIESLRSYGGGTSLSFKVHSFEVKECILWLSIVFITILCTPQPTIIRWSTTPPVSTDVLHQWKGFCALIANAYYTKGMACENIAARTNGRHGQFGGTIGGSKSDAISFQYIRGSQPTMAKSVMERNQCDHTKVCKFTGLMPDPGPWMEGTKLL